MDMYFTPNYHAWLHSTLLWRLFVSETAKTLINEDNARRGTIKVFEAVQNVQLNKHMFYVSIGCCSVKMHRSDYQSASQPVGRSVGQSVSK